MSVEIDFSNKSKKGSPSGNNQATEALKVDLMNLIIKENDDSGDLKVSSKDYQAVAIHDEWREIGGKTCFSYQEIAVKNFIYRFNKCGILSDQVGMGKTIEAGMIISELAYRKDLSSLLILVPNENMAEKWENELAKKFGFRNVYEDMEITVGTTVRTVPYDEFPVVYTVSSEDDLYALMYTAYEKTVKGKKEFDENVIRMGESLFPKIIESDKPQIKKKIEEIIKKVPRNSKECKVRVLDEVFLPYVEKLRKHIEVGMAFKAYERDEDANKRLWYLFVDRILDNVDAVGSDPAESIRDRLFDTKQISRCIVNEFKGIKAEEGRKYLQKIAKDYENASDEKRRGFKNEIKRIADNLSKIFSVLIVSKNVTKDGKSLNLLNDVKLFESLAFASFSSIYVNDIDSREYRFIDLLIDASYRTLIVDEAHDYIKVSHKKPMSMAVRKNPLLEVDMNVTNKDVCDRLRMEFEEIRENDMLQYNVFPLFDDYYFVRKDCLYVKLKSLADRSYRKIFMTATPIKSEMVDFYLLKMLADNADAAALSRIRKIITDEQVQKIQSKLIGKLSDNFKKSINFVSKEDLVLRYIHLVLDNMDPDQTGGTVESRIGLIIADLCEERLDNVDLYLLHRACVNKARKEFEDTFTDTDASGNENKIQTISELVNSEKGIKAWQSMYSQLGIRSTRHQTYRLDEEHKDLLSESQRERYDNLPEWSQRNGTLIHIYLRDNAFDFMVRDMIKERRNKMHEDVLTEEEEERKKREGKNSTPALVDAYKIFDYINEKLTGANKAAEYFGVDLEDYIDFKLHMVMLLMTEGLSFAGEDPEDKKKVKGKVLLFTDAATQKEVFKRLRKEMEKPQASFDVEAYKKNYGHYPLWWYNEYSKLQHWEVTDDVRALKEKEGNVLIVPEPDKYEEGVDLQVANTLINFDIKFCPLKMEQRIGRIDRVKMLDGQDKLDIISFTPCNDLSGFMVEFLANKLQMFSCWRGDTTGIVSLPIGESPNSATFEDVVIHINDAYKALYAFDIGEFERCYANVRKNYAVAKKDDSLAFKHVEIEDDFEFLRSVENAMNLITKNTIAGNVLTGDSGKILFGELAEHTAEKTYGEVKRINSKKDLTEEIEEYYRNGIDFARTKAEKLVNSANNSAEKVGSVHGPGEALTERIDKWKKIEKEMTEESNRFGRSELKAPEFASRMSIECSVLKEILDPLRNRYEGIIKKYLNELIRIFDVLCDDVSEKSKQMSRFTAQITIGELERMVKSNGND